jgi:ornithine decarboxylase
VFPSHTDAEYVPAVIAGPTCDSDDAYAYEHNLVQVPKAAASGDPVWILSCGAYATSYTTQGFNGFNPLPVTWIHGEHNGGNDSQYQGPLSGVDIGMEGLE